MKTRLFIASDHAGVELKTQLISACQGRGIEMVDLGPTDSASVDYPDFANQLCEKVSKLPPEEKLKPCGVLICGSGVGMSMAANRHPGIRAVLALRKDVAVLSREHNASNVLCLGARLIPDATAFEILWAWTQTNFAGGRHLQRVEKLG